MAKSTKYKRAQQVLGVIQQIFLFLSGIFLGAGEIINSVITIIVFIIIGTVKIELFYSMQKYIIREEMERSKNGS